MMTMCFSPPDSTLCTALASNGVKSKTRANAFGSQQWLIKRAMPPMRVASMICSLSNLFIHKYDHHFKGFKVNNMPNLSNTKKLNKIKKAHLNK